MRSVKQARNTSGENVRGKRSHNKVDRLSSLPDSVLLKILSLLPTTTTVRTGKLAKRWRFLWTRVPVLDFDFRCKRMDPGSEYCDPDQSTVVDWRDIRHGKIGFADFIQRVLLLHKVQDLDTFRLVYYLYDILDFQLHTFLSVVIERGVKNLDVDCGVAGKRLRHGNKLPSFLFCCKTLVVLKLSGYFIHIKLGSSVSLLILRELHLNDIRFADDETFGRMISGCPVIQKLSVCGVHFGKQSRTRLWSLTLECLTLESRRDLEESDYDLQIYAPSLRNLTLLEVFPQFLFAPSLVEAHIQVYWRRPGCVFRKHVLFNLLNSLTEIKSLTLRCDILFDDSSLGALTTQFQSLKSLRFDGHRNFMFKLLEHANNLESLTCSISNGVSLHEELIINENCWWEPSEVPKCLLSQVKYIEYFHKTSVTVDVAVIEYLLKNARVLLNMIIRTNPGNPQKLDVLQRFSSFKRASTKSVLLFM